MIMMICCQQCLPKAVGTVLQGDVLMSSEKNGGVAQAPLQGQVAVVTGASSGIGAATARRLAGAGAQVVVGFNSGADRANAIVESLPGGKERHVALRMPMENTPALVEAENQTATRFGRCDILINSAGFTRAIPHVDLDALDDATFDAIMVANVRGPFATIRAFAPLMKKGDRSVVVNISSISAFTGSGSSVAYCASKAALDTMSMSLARALGPEIRVLSVSPAAVNTGFVPGRSLEAIEKAAAITPLRKIVEADDVALAIMACVTHLTVATGTVIVVDGGRHL
jgi:3-oxoacyl-[acyl-carrier protein] reductase